MCSKAYNTNVRAQKAHSAFFSLTTHFLAFALKIKYFDDLCLFSDAIFVPDENLSTLTRRLMPLLVSFPQSLWDVMEMVAPF